MNEIEIRATLGAFPDESIEDAARRVVAALCAERRASAAQGHRVNELEEQLRDSRERVVACRDALAREERERADSNALLREHRAARHVMRGLARYRGEINMGEIEDENTAAAARHVMRGLARYRGEINMGEIEDENTAAAARRVVAALSAEAAGAAADRWRVRWRAAMAALDVLRVPDVGPDGRLLDAHERIALLAAQGRMPHPEQCQCSYCRRWAGRHEAAAAALRTATGRMLDHCVALACGLDRAPGETDDSLRTRCWHARRRGAYGRCGR